MPARANGTALAFVLLIPAAAFLLREAQEQEKKSISEKVRGAFLTSAPFLYMPSYALWLPAGRLSLFMAPERSDKPGLKGALTGVLVLACTVLVGAYSGQTVLQNMNWKNDLFFWEDMIRKVPDYGLPHLNPGVDCRETGSTEDAEGENRAVEAAKNTDEGKAAAYNNLGNIYTVGSR